MKITNIQLDKVFYKILAVLAAFGAIGAGFVGLQFTVKALDTGDFQNALLPGLVAIPCAALAFFARGKASAADSTANIECK